MQINLSMISDTSEALERMKTMQQHMPGLNYSGDKSMRQAVSQPSYIQTGPPVFPEPVPTSTMRHPGPQYFEENRFVYKHATAKKNMCFRLREILKKGR